MSRTADQIAADDALTAAIEQVWRAYAAEDEQGALIDYVVIGSMRYLNSDGEAVTIIGSFDKDSCVPLYSQIGLVRYESARLEAFVGTLGASDE